jgi:hypothetical protein
MTLFPQNKALPNGYARRGWSGGYETPHRVLVALAVKLNAMLGLTAANATELVILNRPTRFPGDKGIWVPFPAPGAAVLAIRIWDMLDDVFIVVCN